MAKKKRRRRKAAHANRRPVSVPEVGPSILGEKVSSVAGQLAVRELRAQRWSRALEYAEQANDADRKVVNTVIAEASFRLARRAVITGDFGTAQGYAEQAVVANPLDRAFQAQLTLIRKAARRILREGDARFFPDTVGSTSGKWWKRDLLARVRGWDGQRASVPAPLIMGEITRDHLEDIYALGTYVPWHDGIPPKFTQYVRELKKHGNTVGQAAALLWQGLTSDVESSAPDWIEQIDVIVPMATGWRSYEVRGHEITEDLASELASLLCVPMVDVFERDPDAASTHQLGGFGPRLSALIEELRVKNADVADLARARGVLIVDDVVTYGATFEACARRLKEAHPHLRCWGAALAYTQTKARREKALAERE